METSRANGFHGPYNKTLKLLTRDLERHNPRAVVVFGSMARLLAGVQADQPPNDIDVMVIGDLLPDTISKGVTRSRMFTLPGW